ncbi:MAG: hypothetical protein WB992_12230 [Bryobacteraceae bacterium]
MRLHDRRILMSTYGAVGLNNDVYDSGFVSQAHKHESLAVPDFGA